MARYLRQNSNTTLKMGPFIASADFITPQNTLTISASNVKLSKNGGALTAKTEPSNVTNSDADGYYAIALSATDVNTLGRLRAEVSLSGSLPVWDDFVVLSQSVYDSLFGSTALATVGSEVTLTTATRVMLSADQPDYAPALQSTLIAGINNISGSEAIIITKVDNLSGGQSTIITKVDNISASLASVGTNVTLVSGAVWDELLTGTAHNITRSAGRRLRQVGAYSIYESTLPSQAGISANAVKLDSGASDVNGAYDPALITIIAGTGWGQTRTIYQYIGATRMAYLDRDWKVQPDNTSDYQILTDAGREEVNEGLVTSATSNTVTLNANASDIDDNYKGQLVFIRSGTGQDQVRVVSGYNGTTHTAIISEVWGVIPLSSSCYVMLPNHVHELVEIADQVNSTLTSAHGAGQWDAVSNTPVVLSASQPYYAPAKESTLIDLSGSMPTAVEIREEMDGYSNKLEAILNTDSNIIDAVLAIPTNPLLTTDVRLNNLDATISSRSAEISATANKNAIMTGVTSISGNVWNNSNRTLTQAVSVSGNVTLDPNTRVVLSASQPDYNVAKEISATANKNLIIQSMTSISGDVNTILTSAHGAGMWDAVSNTPVVLSASQPYYAPAIAGDAMGLIPALSASILKHEDLLDGKTVDYILEATMAMVNGNFSISGDTLTLYKRDGLTPFSVINKTTTTRTRVS